MTYTGGMFMSEQPTGELPKIEVPVFVVIDHDRTRARVDAGVDRLLHLAARHGIDEMAVRQAQASIEADGMSFAPLGFIRELLARNGRQAELAQLRDEFVANGSKADQLLYPGVSQFEHGLRSAPSVPHMVLTAGVDTEWQEWKLAASGFDGYARIIPVPEGSPTPPKGPVITSWQSPDNTYGVAAYDTAGRPVALIRAHNVMLIDDKAVSFQGLPAGSRGAYVVYDDAGLISQGNASMLPADCSITTVHDLSAINMQLLRPEAGTTNIGILGQAVSYIPLALDGEPAKAA